MAAKVSSLTGSLTLTVAGWTQGLKQATKDAEALKKSVKPVADFAGSIGKAMSAAGALVGGALLGMARSAANYGDEMLEASQKTGIGTKQLAALRLVAESSGSSFEGITAGVSKLSTSMFEATTKGGEAAKTFQALGISVKDSNGKLREASDVLPEIAGKFASMRDGTEKTALAIKLFGKAGADLIPALNGGAEAILNAQRATEKYNVAITEAEAALGDEFNDTLGETSLAMKGLSVQIGNALLPSLIKMVGTVNNVIAAVSSWAKAHPDLTRAIAGTSAVLVGSGGLLYGMSKFLQFAPGMLGNVSSLAKAFWGLSVPMRILIGAVAALTAAFIAFPKIRGPVIDALARINQVAFAQIDLLGRLGGIVLTLIQGKFRDAWETLKGLPDQVVDSWESRGRMVRDAAKSIGDTVGGLNSALNVDIPQVQMPGIDSSAFDTDAKALKDKAGQLADAMTEALRPADVLGEELAVLQKQFSNSQIIAVYGDKILDAAQAQREHGFEVRANVLDLLKQMNAMEDLTALQDRVAERWTKIADEMEKEREAFRRMTPDLFGGEIGITRDPAAQAQLDELARRGRLTSSIRNQAQEISQLADDMVRLKREGYSTAQIEAALGSRMEDVLDRAKDLGVGLDEVTRKTLDQAGRAETLRKAWGKTFSEISDRLVDMIVDFNFNFKGLVDIAKDTAKSLARSFLDGFFKPFKDGLESLGQKAGAALGNILFGGAGPGAAGSGGSSGGIFAGLNGALGGVLGGIFGKGGASAGGTATGVASTGMSAAMGWAMLGSSLVGPLATALGKIGAGRDSANEIVKLENAFVKQTLAGILADTSLSATNKLKLVGNEFDIFQGGLDRYAASGGENAVTANQSLATVSPLVAQIVRDLYAAGANLNGKEAGVGGETTITHTYGDINISFVLPAEVNTPEKWLDWLDKNKAGIRTRIAESVFAIEEAILTR